MWCFWMSLILRCIQLFFYLKFHAFHTSPDKYWQKYESPFLICAVVVRVVLYLNAYHLKFKSWMNSRLRLRPWLWCTVSYWNLRKLETVSKIWKWLLCIGGNFGSENPRHWGVIWVHVVLLLIIPCSPPGIPIWCLWQWLFHPH